MSSLGELHPNDVLGDAHATKVPFCLYHDINAMEGVFVFQAAFGYLEWGGAR